MLTGLAALGSAGLPAPEPILVLTSASLSLLPPSGGFCLAQNRREVRREQGEMGSRWQPS